MLRQEKLFHQDDFRIRFGLDFFQTVPIALLKICVWHPAFVRGVMPCVVHADQNGYEIRLKVDAVALPARTEAFRTVAADPLIVEGEIHIRMACGNVRGGVFRVSLPHIFLIASVPSRIGDAVALK